MNLDYLTNLNESQEEAVLYLNGPLLIVAGAGSGKTRVLTSRIVNKIKEIVKFDKITARISNLCSKDDLKKAGSS